MNDSAEFEIRIEFTRGVGDPTRVFRTMAGLIESTQRLDAHLALMIGANVRTTLVLQDIEATSLKSRLRSIIESVPDEAVQSGDIKKVIGHFLLKGKHKVIDWCADKKEIADRGQVKQLEADLVQLAKETDVKLLPAYAAPDTPKLLADISAVNDALVPLDKADNATFSSDEGVSRYNPGLAVSEDVIRDIVTRERIVSTGERILKIKKPDFLGTSKWSFRYGHHMIEAKITDLNLGFP